MPLTITDGALAWQRLAVKNAHPRDERITFDEATHSYTIDGTREGWISCTQFIHSFFGDFDADAIIKKMMSSRKWTESKYYGLKPDEIKAQWDKNRDEAANAGTRMHLDIEHYYNAEPVGNLAGDAWDPNPGPEWDYFMAYERKWRIPHGFEAFRSEWLVFKEDIKLAGSIDMIYKKPDGTLAIYDWKRAKEMKYENPWQSGKAPLDHLPDTNYWHYSIQLNIYRTILEQFYGAKVSELALVVLHPDNSSFRVIQVNRMEDEVEAMFEDRREKIKAGTAKCSADVEGAH
jgi:hypothetical protein